MAKKIMESSLAPWQRIDALKTFFFPCLLFSMHTAQLSKGDWRKVDDLLRPAVKRTLNIPKEASNNYLYGLSGKGALGLPLASEDSDIAAIDGAFKLLTFRDLAVRLLAWEDLTSFVQARLQCPTSPELIAQFLSAADDGPFAGTTNRISSMWSAARAASRRLNITWSIDNEHLPSISYGGFTIYASKRNSIFKSIRHHMRSVRLQDLVSLPNQGKAMECVADSKCSSHFFRDGAFTRFAEWRFIHRARLNLVPLNAAKPCYQSNRQCRRCPFPNETLPHVLNNYMRNSRLYQQRHNAVVERIKKAANGRWSILYENQVFPGTNLRPDLVLCKGSSALVLDITVPFENRLAAFSAARQDKVSKYRPVVEVCFIFSLISPIDA
ncbi:uncharacterized protein LOC118180627 [Stegodyphus dumicola]|uniref:uncharacterized protein LOC118180627 n=1 Tax=Stegodyphus dumicola TaxID=202533 RepID=UPI0015B21040|nr:uncharacterized protein LOC118180627 [Stegodyphus dumicola]